MSTVETFTTNSMRDVPEMTIKAIMPEYPKDRGSDLGYFASNEDEEDYVDELAEESLMYDKEKSSPAYSIPFALGKSLTRDTV